MCVCGVGRDSPVGLSLYLWDLMVSPGNSLRIELNGRTPSWCHRELLVVGETPHIWWPQVSEVKCSVWVSKGDSGKKHTVGKNWAFPYTERKKLSFFPLQKWPSNILATPTFWPEPKVTTSISSKLLEEVEILSPKMYRLFKFYFLPFL